MNEKTTLELSPDVREEVEHLASLLGYPPEAAVSYAVRFVSACIREGLLEDFPIGMRPETDEQEETEDLPEAGRVIAFPGAKK